MLRGNWSNRITAGEGSQRIGQKCIHRKLTLLGPQLEEIFADPVVELRAAAPPLLRMQPEPEFENV